MRSSPSVPLVEILPGHDSREGSADMGGGTLYEPCLWGCRWCSLWDTIRARGVLQEKGLDGERREEGAAHAEKEVGGGRRTTKRGGGEGVEEHGARMKRRSKRMTRRGNDRRQRR